MPDDSQNTQKPKVIRIQKPKNEQAVPVSPAEEPQEKQMPETGAARPEGMDPEQIVEEAHKELA